MNYELAELTPEDAYKIQDDFGIKERGFRGKTPTKGPVERMEYRGPADRMLISIWALDRKNNSYLSNIVSRSRGPETYFESEWYLFYFENDGYVLTTTDYFNLEFVSEVDPAKLEKVKEALRCAFKVHGRFGGGKGLDVKFKE